MIDWTRVLELAGTLPEVEPGYSYGTPALKLRNKLIARLREDGETLVVRADVDEREALIAAAPEKFFLTPHYQPHPWVLVRLSRVEPDELRELLTDAWLLRAPKRLASRLEESGFVPPRRLRDRARTALSRVSERSGRPSDRRPADRA
ncbi:MAG TPA: MmcQ/YjbR family DNA-binding protein [Solirubrobacteraceae bacterium]